MANGYFYFKQYVGCDWQDEKKEALLLHFKIDYTDVESEYFDFRMTPSNEEITYLADNPVQEDPARERCKRTTFDNENHKGKIISKVRKWIDDAR